MQWALVMCVQGLGLETSSEGKLAGTRVTLLSIRVMRGAKQEEMP